MTFPKPFRLSVILPAFNEADTLGRVLDELQRVRFDSLAQPIEMQIVVVDDASSDSTPEIAAARPNVLLLRHNVNKGKGAAIQTGLEHVNGDVVIIQDADLEYAVSDYPELIRPFLECSAQVVYGSRFLKRRHPRNMHWANWLANRMLTFTANVLFRAHITDEATCFKLFRADLFKSLPLRAGGFDFCPEVTALVRLRKIPIIEVPVDYTARTVAEGKKVKWTDGLAAMKTLIMHRLRGSRCR